ncbi:MAG: GTPase HflX [Deltaproteobacteria bacterium]
MERAILVTVKLDKDKHTWDVVERQRELKELAATAGADILSEDLCHRDMPTPDLYLGEGKVKELSDAVRAHEAQLLIFNNDLSGTQHRNLEKALETKVVDRTQLILDIFARHARSPEGKAQVELAQLEYLLPRLAGKGTELSRLGGGIGTRGPGEQKLEEDRRRIRDRVRALKEGLKDLGFRRETRRRKRREVSVPTVTLIGYTSAGKSTLFNALTGEGQTVSRGLFTTLDPLSRQVALPNGQHIVLSDTVGFIRDLPAHLVEAFKATLEEVAEADLLLHVMDAGHPRLRDHADAVQEVLEALGASHKETLVVLNKTDLFEDPRVLDRLGRDWPGSVGVSALRRTHLDALLHKVQETLCGYFEEVSVVLPHARRGLVDVLYREGRVREIAYLEDGIHVRAELPAVAARQFRKLVQE